MNIYNFKKYIKTIIYYIYGEKLQIHDIKYNKYKINYCIFKFFIYI